MRITPVDLVSYVSFLAENESKKSDCPVPKDIAKLLNVNSLRERYGSVKLD